MTDDGPEVTEVWETLLRNGALAAHAAVAAAVVSLLVRRCGPLRGSTLRVTAACMSLGVACSRGSLPAVRRQHWAVAAAIALVLALPACFRGENTQQTEQIDRRLRANQTPSVQPDEKVLLNAPMASTMESFFVPDKTGHILHMP